MTIIDTDGLDGREIVAELHPLSAISRDHTRQASDELAELVRYLNHVTFHDEALPFPNDTDSVVANLSAALDMLPQLMEQIRRRLMRWTNRSVLSTDDGSDSDNRIAIAMVGLERVSTFVIAAASTMRDVRRETSHLCLDTDD